MARKCITFLFLIFLFCDLLVSPVSASAFPNAGFETSPTGGTNDWSVLPSGWVWDGSTAHSGTHSARISRTSGTETANIWSANLPVLPSTEYTLSYWLRTESAIFYPRVILYQYTSSNALAGPYFAAYANIGNGTNGWNAVNYRFQTMPNASYIRLRIYLSTDTTGTFWFDDFGLLQGAPARFRFQTGFPVAASGPNWLSSPTVADINHDGSNELLIGAGSAVNGWDKNGHILPGYPLATGDRTIVAQIALADLDNDGRMEIAAGTRAIDTEGQCRVFIWHDNGTLVNGWPQKVAWNPDFSNSNCWITSVVLADIDGDRNLEILASTTNNGAGNVYRDLITPNLYAWHIDGTLVSGNWPNQQTTAGIYGALAAGDVNGDGKADVMVGRDYIYLNVYGSNGESLPGWPIKTFVNRNNGVYDTEQRIGYSVNAPVIADLDNDGNKELIAVGHVGGPGNPVPELKLNNAMLVLEPDGNRRPGWETAALGSGVLTQVDLPWQGPAVADLNGDGRQEIVVATEDGWIRAYQADKLLLWAFNYTQGATLLPSDPVIGDIDGDGAPEIIFGTYVPEINGTDKDGPVGLWALKANGSVVPGFPLAVPTPGIRSAPTLADLDGDGKLEIIAATRNGQVIVWRTEAPYDPLQMPWPTGRHDLRRTGSYTSQNALLASSLSASSTNVKHGDGVTFDVHIAGNAPVEEAISMTNPIPAGTTFIPGSLSATSGNAIFTGSEINWSGNLPGSQTVDIIYSVSVTTTARQAIRSTATISTPSNGQLQRSATIYANFFHFFLPEVNK